MTSMYPESSLSDLPRGAPCVASDLRNPPSLDSECSEIPASELLAEGWAPAWSDKDVVIIAVSVTPDRQLEERIRKRIPGRRLSFLPVSHVELQDYVLRNHRAELADYMANHFPSTYPEFTAKNGFAKWQMALGAIALVVTTVLFAAAPTILMLILSGLFLLTTTIKIVIAVTSLLPAAWFASGKEPPAGAPVTDGALPFYTVLVPVYEETAVMAQLVRCLGEMTYPQDRLEILFLIEEHDVATKAAALAAGLAPHMRVIDLPPGPPQTKPRSCNLGLLLARGDLVVIFDAEDRPDPDQLLKSAAAFAASPDGKLACVQARLFFYNANRNLLTRQFALEYTLRYGMILPGLARLGLPIPLGGTSNHFNTAILRTAGGWDAWNVTEDADLGMRFRALGYRVDMIDSVTWEEATSTPQAWVRQRTRWLKGFMVTVLVHTRHPWQSLRRFRPSGMVTLLGIVGGTPVTFLGQPVAFALLAVNLLGIHWSPLDQGAHNELTSVLLLAATVLMMGVTVAAAIQRKMSFSHLACLLPGYWLLYWVAAWRALFQLVRSPFVWEKTPHGRDAGPQPGDTP
jgi:cellulose synthase/poly-beta-1,6-N-acetylglucosamine synthase-like glycosyltransferase